MQVLGDIITSAVENAIDIGYRSFDTAFAYDNEQEIGTAIANKIAEGVVKREDLFITSKVCNSENISFVFDTNKKT